MAKEERERVVKSVLSDLEKKHAAGKLDTELEEMQRVRQMAQKRVRTLIAPIFEYAKVTGPSDPNHIHSDIGRARMLLQLHKFYLDDPGIRQLSRDEAVFMLALAYSEFHLNDMV